MKIWLTTLVGLCLLMSTGCTPKEIKKWAREEARKEHEAKGFVSESRAREIAQEASLSEDRVREIAGEEANEEVVHYHKNTQEPFNREIQKRVNTVVTNLGGEDFEKRGILKVRDDDDKEVSLKPLFAKAKKDQSKLDELDKNIREMKSRLSSMPSHDANPPGGSTYGSPAPPGSQPPRDVPPDRPPWLKRPRWRYWGPQHKSVMENARRAHLDEAKLWYQTKKVRWEWVEQPADQDQPEGTVVIEYRFMKSGQPYVKFLMDPPQVEEGDPTKKVSPKDKDDPRLEVKLWPGR